MANQNMHRAKTYQNDEFYTQLADIENELRHYRDQLQGKSIFMNCDDPEESNFWKYFYYNFDFLGLSKITSTHYHQEHSTYKLEYDGTGEPIKTDLIGNGDFRSNEAIEILEQSDVVITNPPFSLYREYVAQLMAHEKDFLIIGNFNSVTYKEIFPLIKEGKMWLGYNPVREFMQPDGTIKKFGNINWFTNLDVAKRNDNIILVNKYNKVDYPSYDNYDAIEVGRVANIPEDYYGVMGVPITFLTRHNPKQFKIVGMTSGRDEFEATPTKRYVNAVQHNRNGTTTSGSKANTRATILLDKKPDKIYYTADNADGPLRIMYARILVQRRDVHED